MAGETVWVTEGDDPIRLVFRNEQTARVATSDEDIDVEACELHPAGTGAELERLRAIVARVKDDELAYAVGIDPDGKPGRYAGVLDYRRRVLGEETP